MMPNNSEDTLNNLAALTSTMELLLGLIANDFIIFSAFLIISPFIKMDFRTKEIQNYRYSKSG
jgi:hypothetical protein